MSLKPFVPTALLLALLVPAAPAQAADVRAIWEPWNGGTTLDFEADLGEDNTVDIALVGGDYIVTDTTAPLTSGDMSCTIVASTATCPATDVVQVRVHLHDLDDSVDVFSPVYAQMEGGTGSDVMLSGDGDDDLSGEGLIVPGSVGGGGGDRIEGRGGSDSIFGDDEGFAGTSGNDILLGGPGDEIIFAGGGDDIVDGGPGRDGVDDGGGNDTVALGDDDDVYFGSESAGNDGISGDGGNDTLHASQNVDGADTLGGGTGTDSVIYTQLTVNPLAPDNPPEEPRTIPVDASLDNQANDGSGDEGDDVRADVETVVGGTSDDTLVGGAGPETLAGGAGEDYVDGGAGADALNGGTGPDLLRARDGGTDGSAACGDGADFVIADPADNPGGDCEQVDDVLQDRPVGGQRIAVQPRGPALAMQLPTQTVQVPMIDHVNLPVETIVDTTRGRAKVVSLGPPKRRKRGKKRARRHQRATIWDAEFKLRQGRDRRAATVFELAGGEEVECPDNLARRKKKRGGWSSKPKGKFATAGLNGSALSSKGAARWFTEDRCAGTFFRSNRGPLKVRDFDRRRKVLVDPRGKYLARD